MRTLETKEATLIFLQSEGRTLMLHRNKNPDDFLYGKWTNPGGKLNPEETPGECAERELLEETGLRADLTYKGKVLFDNRKRTFNGKPAEYNWLVHIYQANAYRGELRANLHEGELEWIADSDIKDLPMEEADKLIFDILNNSRMLNKISLRIIYNGARFELCKPLNP